ncbi:MAG: protein TolR [Desulfobacteraceae bacterium 4572_19]|nr:MAG: protein TolR [Desulfobacteraceae bacterium 4572_19]
MTSGNGDEQLMSEINITPFVDVMLVLLIIFMVTAPMLVQGVNVSLPEAETASLQSDKDHLIISINGDRQIFINDLQVKFDFLREKLSKIFAGKKDQELYLKADKDVPYGMVVVVMAEAKAAGFEKLGMITLPPTTQNK